MSYIQIERLKKDRNEALYYQRKLMKKGKDVLAYKMEKKIAHLNHFLDDMEAISKAHWLFPSVKKCKISFTEGFTFAKKYDIIYLY